MGGVLFRPKNHYLSNYKFKQEMERKKYENVLFPMRIILFGDEKVGKTSICKSFDYNDIDEDYTPTVGTDKLETNYRLNDEKEVKLIIWDTTGNERLLETSINNLHYIEGIILVFDVTNKQSFENIKGWLTKINDYFGNKATIILFGNKVDEDKEIKVTEEEIKLFCGKKELKYFGVSAKNKIGIEEGFTYLIEKIYEIRKKNNNLE